MKALLILLLLSFSASMASQDLARHKYAFSHASKTEDYQIFADDGAWCWFSDPRAVYFEGMHKRTYAGWIDSQGNVTVGYYDHTEKSIQTKILMTGYQVDDHDNPALLFGPGSRLMVFFTKHGGANPTQMFTMKNAEDIFSWETRELYLNDMDYYNGFENTNTYVNPVMLAEENNRIYLFWRGVDNKPNYSYSDDLGNSWTKGRIFVLPERIYNMRRPYMKVESNGRNKIFFAFTDGHPDAERENSIYYMYYEAGNLFNAEGRKIGDLGGEPVKPREASVVYDASLTKEKAWIWDIAIDRNGNPVLVYARFPDNSNHIYSYARWDGKRWINTDLINSGKWFPDDPEREQNYSGGIVLDHENPDVLYLSVDRGSGFGVERWVRKNDSRWKAEALTKNDGKDNVRPVAVRNAGKGNPLQLLWMENNRYVHYTDYNSVIKMNLLLFE